MYKKTYNLGINIDFLRSGISIFRIEYLEKYY